jgi:hypothetical protein
MRRTKLFPGKSRFPTDVAFADRNVPPERIEY